MKDRIARIYGVGGDFKCFIQDRTGRGIEAVEKYTREIAYKAMKESPEVSLAFTTYRISTPQLYVDIDRERAQKLNVPMGSVAEIRRIIGPDTVNRYNLYPAAEIIGNVAEGYSTGEAMAAIERAAAEVLPEGMGLEWTDLAYQEKRAGNESIYIFALCVLFVFLILAALYESWSLPLSIILIVPLVLLFALLGMDVRGIDNNLMGQIGMVVLIGLACKNAILIAEFAKQRQERGEEIVSSVSNAAKNRLRPILMTSFAFILGVVPLAYATGSASELRQALGTSVFYGMIGVTFMGLIFTPVFFYLIRKNYKAQ